MSKIAIVTDSTGDIPQDLIEKYNIKIVPLYVNFGDESFTDNGVDITTKRILRKTKRRKSPSQVLAAYPC